MLIVRKEFVFLLFLLSTLLFAVSAEAFTISPLRYQISNNPGTSQTVTVTVRNDQTTAQVFKVLVTGVKQDSSGRPLFGSGFDVAEEWVKPETSILRLAAGQTKRVGFLVSVPTGVEPGVHLLGLTIEPQAKKSDQVQLATRAATLLSIAVAGTINEALSIEQWVATFPITSGKKWPVNLTVKNNGSVPLAVVGAVQVRDWLGTEVLNQPVLFGNGIFTQSLRSLSPLFEVNKALWPGPYQVQISINYGLSRATTSALTTIWYLPLWSAIIPLALILFFIGKKVWFKK